MGLTLKESSGVDIQAYDPGDGLVPPLVLRQGSEHSPPTAEVRAIW